MHEQNRQRIRAALEQQPGAVLEELAATLGVTPCEVVQCLPPQQSATIPGTHFAELLQEIANWGAITLVINTGDVILEVKGELPHGQSAHGYFNLHGSPIGGHLKAERCALIAFVSRPLFRTDTHSLQFYNQAGGCMFKIYLGRDDTGAMRSEQIARFQAARTRFADI